MGQLPGLTEAPYLIATPSSLLEATPRAANFFHARFVAATQPASPPASSPILPTVPNPTAARPRVSAPIHYRRRDWKRWTLLAVYVSAYGGFIGVAVAAPALLATAVIGGINLAVVWGFALIVLAFIVALAALRLPEQG